MGKSDRIARQIAALPVRRDKNGALRVLMVTSRDRGRWVMPKGWTMDGKTPWQAAEIEALEEAGAVGHISDRQIGEYHYDKRLGRGKSRRCEVTLYPLMVRKLKRRWKEEGQRKRRWFAPAKAAKLVEERELAQILQDLATAPEQLDAFEELQKAA